MKTSKIASQIIEKYTTEKNAISLSYKTSPNKLSAYSDYDGETTALSIVENINEDSISPEMIELKNDIIQKMKTFDNYINNKIIEIQNENEKNIKKIKELNEIAMCELEKISTDFISNINHKNINFKNPITITYSGVILQYSKQIKEVYEELDLFYVSIENKDFIFFNSDSVNSKELIKKIWFNFSEKIQNKTPDIRSYFQKNKINIFNPNNPLIVEILDKIENM